METILFIAHTESDGSLAKLALESLTAALELKNQMGGSSLKVALIGADVSAAAATLNACGADAVLAVSGPEFSDSRYSSDCSAVEALVNAAGASLVVCPGSSRFNRCLPGAAFRLNGRIETHVSGFTATADSLNIQRWFYRQRMEATLSRKQRPWFLLFDSGVFQAWEGAAGSADFEEVSAALSEDVNLTEVAGTEAPASDAQTIRPDAEMLFVAGAGWTKKQADGQTHIGDAEKIILNFINGAGASLGSSKSLVDQSVEGQEVISYMSHLNQIGQTGSTPRHPKGLASCCHGEEPHVVGWRFINERRAINLDAGCGWAQGKADVLYVADAFEVMAKVTELLQE